MVAIMMRTPASTLRESVLTTGMRLKTSRDQNTIPDCFCGAFASVGFSVVFWVWGDG